MSMNKSPQMTSLLEELFNRTTAQKTSICTGCSNTVDPSDFNSNLDKKEYSLSGLCQDCQDGIFKVGELKDKIINKAVLSQLVQLLMKKINIESSNKDMTQDVSLMVEGMILDNLNMFVTEAYDHYMILKKP